MEYGILILTGVLSQILGTLAGGGGLISMPMMMTLGVPIQSAIGATKVSNTVSSLTGFIYLLKNRQITLNESLWIVPVSMISGAAGGFVASRLPGQVMETIAIILLFSALLASFSQKQSFEGDNKLEMNLKSVLGMAGISAYNGFFGPGQATFLFFLLAHLKISYIRSVGLVRVGTFSSCLGAACTFILAGKVLWPVTLSLLAGSIAGSQLGVRLAEKLKPRWVKPILRTIVVLLILQITGNRFL
jgi:Sulfite exporter TauE/SafE.